MAAPLNYRHLYYFWVVAKEGGMARAAARLDMAVQTVSAQVKLLEQSLGYALFKPAGRGMALTEAGVAAMAVAEQIFQLGEGLPAVVREAATGQGLRLAVGISDGLPKLVVRHLLQPALADARVRLLCHEDEFDRLLGDLALHRLDVVLSDRAAPPNPNLRLYSHALGESALSWFAPVSDGEANPGASSRPRWPTCRCCCPPATPPSGRGSTSGSSAWAFARASPASSRTARCWRPSGAAAWAPSRPPAGRTRNC
jgi:LysR family transcriptional activator of nhaA